MKMTTLKMIQKQTVIIKNNQLVNNAFKSETTIMIKLDQ